MFDLTEPYPGLCTRFVMLAFECDRLCDADVFVCLGACYPFEETIHELQ